MTEENISAEQLVWLLIELEQNTKAELAAISGTKPELTQQYLGGKSEFARLAAMIRQVPKDGRARVGTVLNEVKKTIEATIGDKRPAISHQLSAEYFDVTMPGHTPKLGHYHPTTLVVREMNAIFAAMGFSIGDGPEIETDEYNYNRTNLPIDHPARDLQDSLYIEEPNWLLRTHTSSVESHLLQDVKPPFRFVIPGKVYRYENANASNNIMFYQYEGMAVATDITMADLKGTLDVFVRKFFGEKRETRFRCKYYPQVEPGVGIDISCAFCNKKGCTICKGRGWIEMLGAGMVHPNMFRKAGLDPKIYSGFAWGMGLDRIVMQRYRIQDIRSLYNGDIGYRD